MNQGDNSPDATNGLSWLDVDEEFVKSALLMRNYFPRQRPDATELPPVLGSESLSSNAAAELGQLKTRRDSDCPGYGGVELRLTRFDLALRHAQIPHPKPYASLAMAIGEGWSTIAPKISSHRSGLQPRRYVDGRLFVMNSYGDTKADEDIQGLQTFGHKFIVKADIKHFFPSIYTHAIAWAMAGKVKAKKNRRKNGELYNKLDYYFRECRRGETNGVAIGPGTSNVAAELILAEVDRQMAGEGFGNYRRYIDDYTFLASSYSDAVEFVNKLQARLSEYELHLNPIKTNIQALPTPGKPSWLTQLLLRKPPVDAKAAQLNAFIDFAIELSVRHPHGSVLKYMLAILTHGEGSSFKSLPSVAPRLLELTYHQPALIPLFLHVLKAVDFDLPQLQEALTKIAKEALNGMKSDVAAWAIYALQLGRFSISSEVVGIAMARKEVVPLTLLLESNEWGDADVGNYLTESCKGDAYDRHRHWLLAYEAFIRGMFSDHRDESFEVMASHNVQFLSPDVKK